MEIVLFFVIGIIVVFGLRSVQTGQQTGGRHYNDQYNQQLEHVRREAQHSRHMMAQRKALKEMQGPEEVDERTAMQREIGAEIDRIGSQPGGLMQFDINGDGMVDNEEMKIARDQIAQKILGEEPESEPEAAEVSEESKYTW